MNMRLISLLFIGGVSSLFAMKTFELFVAIKNSRWRKMLLFAAFFLLTNMIIYIGDFGNLPPSMLAFFLASLYCCEGIPLKKVAVAMIFASTAFSVSAIIDNYINWHDIAKLGILRNILRLLFYFIFYVGMRRYAPKKNYELSPVLWRLLLMLALTPFGIVIIRILFVDDVMFWYSSPRNTLGGLVLLILAAISFIGLLWTIILLDHHKNLEEQQKLNEINSVYYKSMERHQFEVRRLRHDMANHLQILFGLPDDAKNAYIRELAELPVMQGGITYCQHTVVNAVLNAKMAWMEQENIELEHHISLPEFETVGKSDMCVLFADSIDNAIEACQKLPVGRRKIYIEAKVAKGLMVYCIRNPLPENSQDSKRGKEKAQNCRKSGGGESGQQFPITSKKDLRNHGLGLKSIAEIVERHHGNLEIGEENGQFTLFFYLPITEY